MTALKGTENQGAFDEDDATEQSGAFDSALREAEQRWNIACSIYPDLRTVRSGLARISTSLAFAYVTGLLETKAFNNREQLARHLEQEFLTRHFGTDGRVLAFARDPI